MIKQKFSNGSLRKAKLVGGVLFAFFTFLLFFRIGQLPDFDDSSKSFLPDYELNGEMAFAGEQDFEEAFVDSNLYNDTLIVIDTTAAPSDSFWLTVSLTNTIPVAGFNCMLKYNTSIIYPDYAITDPCYPDTPCTVFSIKGYKTARTEPLSYYVWAGRAFNNHIDTLRFYMATNLFDIPYPHLPAGGSGPVVRFKFWVKPDAEPGATTDIQFILFDPVEQNYANTLADTIGEHNFIPRTRKGTFTVKQAGPPENHCPVFASMPSSFEANEGVTLEFDVTATDEDGDTITLSLDPLEPSGLNYHFDTKEGKGSVTQRFDYTPDFDEAPTTRYATFRAIDQYGCVTTKTVTIEVIETAQDLLISSRQQGGVPGSAGRLVPFMITNSVDIYGFQFTFRWDPAKLDVDSIVRTDAIEGFSMYTNLGDSAGKATVLVFGLAGQTIPAGLDSVVYPAFSVFPDAPPGEVDILLENAREAINPGYPSQPLGMVNGKFTIDMFGDVNLDWMVDVGDVVSLVAYILGELSFTRRQELTSDVNQDSSINVGDLVAMVDIILGRWMGPSPPMYPGPMAVVKLDCEDLQPGSSGEIKVIADLQVPVAGAQLRVDYDPNKVSFQAPRLSERSDHFIVEYRDDEDGKLTLVLYNFSNDPISVGEGNILSLPVMLSPDAEDDSEIELKEVVLADQKAALIPVGDQLPSVPIAFELSQNYPNPFNPSTTIKFTLPSPRDGGTSLPTTLKIHNVLGKVVRTLVDEPMAPGVHHKVWDGKDDHSNQVASGIYFYRLRAGEFQETKKMVLLK